MWYPRSNVLTVTSTRVLWTFAILKVLQQKWTSKYKHTSIHTLCKQRTQKRPTTISIHLITLKNTKLNNWVYATAICHLHSKQSPSFSVWASHQHHHHHQSATQVRLPVNDENKTREIFTQKNIRKMSGSTPLGSIACIDNAGVAYTSKCGSLIIHLSPRSDRTPSCACSSSLRQPASSTAAKQFYVILDAAHRSTIVPLARDSGC